MFKGVLDLTVVADTGVFILIVGVLVLFAAVIFCGAEHVLLGETGSFDDMDDYEDDDGHDYDL